MRIALVVLLLAAACTHHRPLRDAVEVHGDVTLQTFDGRLVEGTATETPTGTVFRTASGEVFEPLSVVRITDRRTLRGAAEGLGLGAGAGALGGIVLGLASGDDPACDECWFQMTAREKAVLGGAVFGGLGAMFGLAAGALLGSQFVYDGGNAAVITPVGPRGSVAGLTVTF